MNESIALSNPEMQDPKSLGAWEVVGLSGVVGTHACLLHTGQVLFFTRPEDPSHRWNDEKDNGLPGDCSRGVNDRDVTLSTIFNVSGDNKYKPQVVQVEHNPFCAGHAFLGDGRLLVAGGDKKDSEEGAFAGVPEGTRYGLDGLRVFTPDKSGPGRWESIGRISGGRWYPTCTLLPDGRVFIISGSSDDQQNYNNQNPTCETIPPLSGEPQYLHFLVEAWPYHSFPFVFVLPSGSLFIFVKDSGYFLRLEMDEFQKERWAVESGPQLMQEPAKHYPNNATSVLLPLLPDEDPKKAYAAEVLLIGGAGANIYPHFANDAIPQIGGHTHEVDALSNCFKLNVYPQVDAAWRPVKSMRNPRVMPDGVLLPDGTVLVVNGVKRGFAGGNPATGPVLPEHAAREAEQYDPVKDEWRTLAEAKCTRLYHSTALLLPDARVLVAGSDHQVNVDRPRRVPDGRERNEAIASGYEYQVEVFSPPYLFTDTPRPVIEHVQECVAYGEQFAIRVRDLPEMAGQDLKAAFLLPGSVTHNNNMSQRHVGLKIVKRSDTHLILEAPPNANIAPPGYYMLFLLHHGVPCEAPFVQLVVEPHNKVRDYWKEVAVSSSSQGIPPSNPQQDAGAEMRGLSSPLHSAPPPPNPVEVSLPMEQMALWLRADSEVGTDENGNVASWSDLSGQGNDVVWKPNTPRQKSEIVGGLPKQCPPRCVQNELNGHPVVRFSVIDYGGKQWGAFLESKKPFLPGTDPYEVFVVAHPWPSGNTGPDDRGTPAVIAWGHFYSHADRCVVFRLGQGPRSVTPPDGHGFKNYLPGEPGKASLVTTWGKQQLGDDNHAPVSFERAVLLETGFDGGSWQVRCNRKLLMSSTVAGKNTGKGTLIIGRNPLVINPNLNYGDFFCGDIAEILVYNRAVTGDERAAIQEYLQNRYNLW
jgi:hypothetical protein